MTWLFALHVLGAVFVVGPLTVLPMLGLRAIREGDRAQIRGMARSTVGFASVAVVTGCLGFGVMSTAEGAHPPTLASTWILWSIVFSAVAVALQLTVVAPALFRAARVGHPAAGSRPYLLVAAVSGVSAVLFVVTVLLMVLQPA